MRKVLEVIGGIVAIITIVGAFVGFTNFWIASKGYITAEQAQLISEKQGYISNKEIKRDLFFIDKRISRVDSSIVVIRGDVKDILKIMRN